jgi:uncharacterized protein (DUF1330 family)
VAAYVVVELKVNDPMQYDEYKMMAPASIAKYGGKYLVRGGKTEILEGKWAPARFVILEFDSVERARQWWSSEEYAPAKRMRQQSASTEMILVEGLKG